MTAIETVIREAVEKGGYISEEKWLSGVHYHAMLLDPAFWQALGKSRGWYEKEKFNDMAKWRVEAGQNGYITPTGAWRQWMHHFIDHIAQGKDAESFFASLTNK